MRLNKILLSALIMSITAVGVNGQTKQTSLVAPTAEQNQIFLEENISANGIFITPSGLQYKIIKAGNGEKPLITDKVSLHFSLKYVNEKVINDKNLTQTWEHHLDKALPGMQEAIIMMPVGSQWMLFLPANLAFGENGDSDVPPGSAVICYVELLEIVK